jgi:hypothetical protein
MAEHVVAVQYFTLTDVALQTCVMAAFVTLRASSSEHEIAARPVDADDQRKRADTTPSWLPKVMAPG